MTSKTRSRPRVKLQAITALVISATCAATSAHDVRVSRAESVGMSTERLQNIGVGMRRLIDEDKIPGTVTLVARRGKVVHFEANGARDVAAGLPMETDTIFRLYSQSKPVTGAAVMMLFEEGHFLLTDPVAKYLPEFADMQVYDGNGGTTPAKTPITIQQLLTHTSGLTYDFFPSPIGQMYQKAGVLGSAPGSPHESLEAWTKALAELPLVAQPGTAWNYSVGMDVLGRLIEVVSGQSFRDFLKTRIFDPLDMPDTDFYVPADKVDRFATNYSPKPGGGMVVADDPSVSPYLRLPAIEMGGSGLVGTVGDYLHFAQMLANKGEFNGTRLLGRKTVEFMTSNHLTPEFPDDPLSSLYSMMGGGGRAWGLGFGITGYVVTNPATAGLPLSKGTYSWGGAATTHFWVDHEEELVGIVHTQLLPDGTYPVIQLMQLLTYQAIVE
jgi:CubicO group peptidase (beta-lactamase class C family)